MDKVRKEILLLEMSCPWTTNRRTKEEEKTSKYAPIRWELKQQYPGYEIKQVNIIIDVLGGYSKEVSTGIKGLLGRERSKEVLKKMQKAILYSGLNITRSFKIIC